MDKVFESTFPFPIEYRLEEGSRSVIVLQEEQLCVKHERLIQSTTPTRFYHAQDNTFLFILKGEMHLKCDQAETILKPHQGTLLPTKQVVLGTLLSPAIELCLVRFINTQASVSEPPQFKKLSTGTSHSSVERNGITAWPLWGAKEGVISIMLYPPQHKETPYYYKQTDQYLLALDNSIAISIDKGEFKECAKTGCFVPKKVRRAFFNPHDKSTPVLSVTTPYPEKGRVLVL